MEEINQCERMRALKKTSSNAWGKTLEVTSNTASSITEGASKFYSNDIMPAAQRASETTAKVYKNDIVPATHKVVAAASAGASAVVGAASTTVEKMKKDISK